MGGGERMKKKEEKIVERWKGFSHLPLKKKKKKKKKKKRGEKEEGKRSGAGRSASYNLAVQSGMGFSSKKGGGLGF